MKVEKEIIIPVQELNRVGIRCNECGAELILDVRKVSVSFAPWFLTTALIAPGLSVLTSSAMA
jgi:hypothetical protein